jgi:hypothetical protein
MKCRSMIASGILPAGISLGSFFPRKALFLLALLSTCPLLPLDTACSPCRRWLPESLDALRTPQFSNVLAPNRPAVALSPPLPPPPPHLLPPSSSSAAAAAAATLPLFLFLLLSSPAPLSSIASSASTAISTSSASPVLLPRASAERYTSTPPPRSPPLSTPNPKVSGGRRCACARIPSPVTRSRASHSDNTAPS